MTLTRSFYLLSHDNVEFDVLVTNPPYSGEHKPRLLQYLANVGKPFALLLPVYTATKSYWKEFAATSTSSRQGGGDCPSVFYLIPPDSYEYRHPEGTGKDIPPFFSSWFIGGLGDCTARSVRKVYSISYNNTPTHAACFSVSLFVFCLFRQFVCDCFSCVVARYGYGCELRTADCLCICICITTAVVGEKYICI